MPASRDDLAAFEAEALARLARAAVDVRSPMRTISLATVGADGRPDARFVILRAFDRASRVARFYTDARAAEVAQLRIRHDVAITAWDPGAKLQVRLSGTVALHQHDALAKAAWHASALSSRAGYAQTIAPATLLASPQDVAPPSQHPDAIETGFANFVVGVVTVSRLEALTLDRDGHRRAAFTRQDAGDWSGHWLAP